MKNRLVPGLAILICAAGFGQVTDRRQTPALPPELQPTVPASTELRAVAIPGVVAAGTKIEFIKEGFQGTEGPVPTPDGGLVFTEGNQLTKIGPDGKTSVFLENTSGSGLAFDPKGRLVMVGAKLKRVEIVYPKGSETVLADNFEGKPFLALNDMVQDRKGGIYFTDIRNLSVYYLPAAGAAVMKVADDIDRANGVQLSPDEKVLYVNNSGGQYLLAFDVQADGSLRNRHDFAKYKGFAMTPQGIHESRADGLAVDAAGRVYGCTPAGVEVFSPEGQALGVIPFPRIPQNLAFGGTDKKTLYVVGNGSAYKVAMLAQGYTGRSK